MVAKIVDQIYVTVVLNLLQTISFFLISSQNSGYCKRNFTPQQFKLRTFKLRSFLTVQFKLSSALLLLLHELELCGETKTDDIDKIDLEGYTFKMKNRKKIGRKPGGIILGYKDHLEHYIENFNKIGVICSSTVKIPKQTDIFVILR
jgi:hypothetical protein